SSKFPVKQVIKDVVKDVASGVTITEAVAKYVQPGLSIPQVSPDEVQEEIVNVANSVYKKGKYRVLTAKLVEVGNPDRKVNTVLVVENIAQRFVGKWYAVEVTHDVDSKGYQT